MDRIGPTKPDCRVKAHAFSSLLPDSGARCDTIIDARPDSVALYS
jgi:hypothetical protein